MHHHVRQVLIEGTLIGHQEEVTSLFRIIPNILPLAEHL